MASETPSFRQFPLRAAFRPLAYSLALHVLVFALFEVVGFGETPPSRMLAGMGTGEDRYATFGGGGAIAGGGGGGDDEGLDGEALRRVLAGEGAPEPTRDEDTTSGSARADSASGAEPEKASAASAESVGAETSQASSSDGGEGAGTKGGAVDAARRAVKGAGSAGTQSARGASASTGSGSGPGDGTGEGRGRGRGRGGDGPTLAAIEAVIRDHYDAIDRCYAAYRSYTAEGRRIVHVQFHLGERPRPLSVSLVKFTTDEKVARCITDAMSAWVFPELSQPTKFDKTFVFHRERTDGMQPGLDDFFGGPSMAD